MLRAGKPRLGPAAPPAPARLAASGARAACAARAEIGDDAHCFAEAAHARRTLQDQAGACWSHCPTWSMLLDGARPAPPEAPGAGDWPHGWQRSSRILTVHSRDRVLLPSLPIFASWRDVWLRRCEAAGVHGVEQFADAAFLQLLFTPHDRRNSISLMSAHLSFVAAVCQAQRSLLDGLSV